MSRRAFLLRVGGAVLIVNALAAQAAVGSSAETVRDWLDRMVQAVETLNYRGTVVYLRDDRMETLRVVHRAEQGAVRERIYSLNGAQREVLRDGDEIRCLFSDDQGLVLQGRLSPQLIPNLPAGQVDGAGEGYRFSLAGSDRVAGMETQIVEIFPLDEFRYGHRLWLERDSGMMLRSELLDSAGQVQHQLMFTEIELGVEIDDAELTPAIAGRERVRAARAPLADESGSIEASWLPASMPPGFRLTAVKKGREGDGYEHLLFSDGFASFSVYIEPGGDAAAVAGLNTVGAVNVYTRAGGDRLITVVGEVPASTVREIGRQLRPVE